MMTSPLRAIVCAVLLVSATPSLAQSPGPVDRLGQFFGRQAPPPAPVGDDDDDAPRVRSDGGASVRVDRLENQVRSLTGQIEQLQFSMRQMQEQLRKFQQDTEFRFQDGGVRPGRRTEEGLPPVVAQATPSSTLPPVTPGGEPARLRRGDAFDPATQPGAPGAPRQIGTLSTGGAAPGVSTTSRLSAGSVGSGDGAPMDLSGGRLAPNGAVVEPSRGPIVGSPLPPAGAAVTSSAPLPNVLNGSGPAVTPGGTVLASREPFSPKDELEMATSYLKSGQYEAAEKGYQAFLQKNPKNRLVPEAVFDLGESYFQRGRHREAAEQYLKISTTYSTSARAPEAMLRLGQSLKAMGTPDAKDQACAAFGKVAHDYPGASPTVKASADREAKRNQC